MNMKKNKRPAPYYVQPDYKLHEFNKRLQHKSEKVDQGWWDDLIREFFEDDATLFIQFKEKSHLRKYTIHRRLIPRYFRSLFDNGVSRVYFMVMEAKENYVNTTATLDCKHATMVAHYGKPTEAKVMTDGHLSIEFNFEDFMRIRSWKFQIRDNIELIPRSVLNECKNEQMKLEELTNNITECGISPSTLQYLRIGVILEPMQELMSRQKSNGMNPRDSLKSALYDKWQSQLLNQDFEQRNRLWSGNGRKSSSNEQPRGAAKKRKPRKTPSVSDGKGSKKKSPSSTFPSLTTSDVMLVDEPMLMGGKFGDEDERVITRLENAQYRSSNNSPPDDLDDAFAPNGNNMSGNTMPGNNISANGMTGNGIASNNISGNNMAGNNIAGNTMSANNNNNNSNSNNMSANNSNISGNNMTGNNITSNSLAGNSLAGSNLSGNNISGSNMNGNPMVSNSLPGGMTGISMSGSGMTGSSMSVNTIAGSNMSGNGMTGNTMPSNGMAGSNIAGNSNMAGNSIAGNTMTGNAMTGNTLNGNGMTGNNISGSNINGNGIDLPASLSNPIASLPQTWNSELSPKKEQE